MFQCIGLFLPDPAALLSTNSWISFSGARNGARTHTCPSGRTWMAIVRRRERTN